jgi:(R,R)-butanediol dehydrogenase / meso-butanediol dehydrogenase / diacetyl reductase
VNATMPRVAVHGPNDVRIDQIEPPVPGPADIVVQVAACGICGTDLGYAKAGGMPVGPGGPVPLGHEFSGTVARLGSDVTGLHVGQRVVVDPTTPANYIGSGGPGAFAPLILVRDVSAQPMVYPIPDSLDFETAALAEPLAVALHGVNRSGAKPGETVVVFGAGPIGLGVVAMLRHKGVIDIIAVDRSNGRLARARALGARVTLNPDEGDVWQAIAVEHGAGELYGMPVVGTDQFIEASGAPPVIPAILANARFHAHLTVIAVHHKDVPVDFAMALAKEMQITTSMAYPTEFGEVVGILARGEIDTSPLVSHRFDFADFTQAFATAADAERAAKVLVTFGGDA